ncbi:MAG: YbaN family protein [Nitrospirales bacterium]
MMIQSTPLRFAVMTAGWISLALGALGVLLPLLPTTPFVLLAAYSFSKSSHRLHHWLTHQAYLGPMIQNWEQFGSISKRAKITATVAMVILFSISLAMLTIGIIFKIALVGIAGGVLAYIWTRPLPPYDTEVTTQVSLSNELRTGH